MQKRSLAVLLSLLVVFVATRVTSAQHAAYYVLDGFGGVHAGGGAPVVIPVTPYFGFDVAIDIAVVPADGLPSTRDGILVLDRFGGVHAGNALASDPPSGQTPYFGFDAARAIAHVGSTVVHSASVSSVGTLLPSARGVTSSSRPETGKYLVTFARSISGCNFVAALSHNSNATQSTTFAGYAGEISSYRTTDTQLVVVTRDSAGTLANRPFHVMVHC